jgi:hypothetical protein
MRSVTVIIDLAHPSGMATRSLSPLGEDEGLEHVASFAQGDRSECLGSMGFGIEEGERAVPEPSREKTGPVSEWQWPVRLQDI